MVGATRIDEATDLHAIEHLDFPIPCCTIRCIDGIGNAADYIVVGSVPVGQATRATPVGGLPRVLRAWQRQSRSARPRSRLADR